MSFSAAASGQNWSQDREAEFQAAKDAYVLAENSRTAEASEIAQATFDYGAALLRMHQMEESPAICWERYTLLMGGWVRLNRIFKRR